MNLLTWPQAFTPGPSILSHALLLTISYLPREVIQNGFERLLGQAEGRLGLKLRGQEEWEGSDESLQIEHL